MQTKIGIIGQGYVGLPLALAAAKAGYLVLGYDNNVKKIDELF
jgi:UDP-N-acetyl-D-glucosamine dehydrogenase